MFIQNNESFVCDNCGAKVEPHPSSSRDHCPFCLWCKHVDIGPGDRKNPCKGLMEPIGLDTREGKTQIIFKCVKCGITRKNIVAPDDNSDKIVELSVNII